MLLDGLRMGRRPGITLVNVMMLTAITTIFLLAASQFVSTALKAGRTQRGNQQVYAVAKAGLEEALSYLRKQPIKPVTIFDPVNVTNETLDQQIGLVKEWEIDTTRHLWARFEVGRCIAAPVRTGVANAGSRNTTLYPATSNYVNGTIAKGLDWAAQDISLQRGKAQTGTVWLLRSRGYTFQRSGSSPTLITTEPFSFTTAARKPIQKIELESEVTLTNFHGREAAAYDFDNTTDASQIATQSQCAITGGHVNIHANGAASNVDVRVLDGMGFNIWCNSAASDVHTTDDAGVSLFGPSKLGMSNTANPNYVSPVLADQLNYSFEVGDTQSLKGIADYVYDNNNPPPPVLPQMAFIYIDAASMTANANTVTMDGTTVAGVTRPKLSGGGVIFVDGTMEVDGSTVPQSWDGLIFVTGNYRQFNTTRVTGSVIAGKHFKLHGQSSKPAKLYYSRFTLDNVIRQVRNYVEQRSTLSIVPGSSEDIIN